MLGDTFKLFFFILVLTAVILAFAFATAAAIAHVGWWLGIIMLLVFTFVICYVTVRGNS